MTALVKGLSAEQSSMWDCENGDRLEVVGFVAHGGLTWALWRDDEGAIHEIPTWAIRLQPAVMA